MNLYNFAKVIFQIFLLSLSSIVLLSAQNAQSRVVYHAEHKLYNDSYNGQNTLHFNNDFALYTHDGYPKEFSENSEENNSIIKIGDKEGAPVFLDFKYNNSYTKLYFGGIGSVILKEELDKINWKITKEQKKIKEYQCILATAEYEGRIYEAWFTPEIPVRYGPYRLRGLPGLILEAASTDGKIEWKFVGYESKTTVKIKLTPSNNGELIDGLDSLKKLKLNYKLKKESRSTSGVKVSIGRKPVDAYIEKDKFDFY